MKKAFALIGFLAVLTLGALALMAPAPAAAKACVQCPVIEDPQCPPCYQLVPQTCEHCAYCKKIPGCRP